MTGFRPTRLFLYLAFFHYLMVLSGFAHAQRPYLDQEVRVEGLPSLMAVSQDPRTVLLTSLDTILHDSQVCCGKDSALEDSLNSADPARDATGRSVAEPAIRRAAVAEPAARRTHRGAAVTKTPACAPADRRGAVASGRRIGMAWVLGTAGARAGNEHPREPNFSALSKTEHRMPLGAQRAREEQ